MSEGQLVKVRLYGGQTALRRVLAVGSDAVIVCSEEEYASAMQEGREPLSLAFPKADIIGELPTEVQKKGPGGIAPRAERGSKAGD